MLLSEQAVREIQEAAQAILQKYGEIASRVEIRVSPDSLDDDEGKTLKDCKLRFDTSPQYFGGYVTKGGSNQMTLPGVEHVGPDFGADIPGVDYYLDVRVLAALAEELKYQDLKWGVAKEQSFPGYLLVIRNELAEAEAGWTKDLKGRSSALHELVQAFTVAYRALATYGTTGCPRATNDETALQAELRQAMDHGLEDGSRA